MERISILNYKCFLLICNRLFSLDIIYELNVTHAGIRYEISHYLPLSFADLFYVRLKSKSFYVLIAAHVLDTGLDQT